MTRRVLSQRTSQKLIGGKVATSIPCYEATKALDLITTFWESLICPNVSGYLSNKMKAQKPKASLKYHEKTPFDRIREEISLPARS